MKNEKHEQMHLVHPQQSVERQAANGTGSHHLSTSKEVPHKHPGNTGHSNLARQLHLRDLVAETACLRHMLANIYPELVCSQKL